jgi:methionine synthase II (cobalamin-independent)
MVQTTTLNMKGYTMRLTEYLTSIKNGIQDKELYSHIDIRKPETRDEITQIRRDLKKQANSTQDILTQ